MSLARLILILCVFSAGFFLGLPDVIALEKLIPVTPYCANNSALVDQAAANPTAADSDHIVISKQRRKLYLLKNGEIVRTYDVAFGFGSQKGPKIRQGDGRTPEGLYFISFKNLQSKYHRALRVSYPNARDIEFAKKLNVPAGSDIMIHGYPRGFLDGLNPSVVRAQHPQVDWTRGCIAVTNEHIEEIFALVKTKIPVEICSL